MSVESELRLANHKLDHQHEMLHEMAGVLADVSRIIHHLVIPGGMTAAEIQQATQRLKTTEAKLHAIAQAPPPTE